MTFHLRLKQLVSRLVTLAILGYVAYMVVVA